MLPCSVVAWLVAAFAGCCGRLGADALQTAPLVTFRTSWTLSSRRAPSKVSRHSKLFIAPSDADADAGAEYMDDADDVSVRGVAGQFLKISGPAFCQLTAEPLASLVDTYYLGKLGPAVLGGAGVAITGGYALGKIVGDPVLRCCISLVAKATTGGQAESDCDEKTSVVTRSSELSNNVTVALLLAAVIGAAQSLVYMYNSAAILNSLGIPGTSEMYRPALGYMKVSHDVLCLFLLISRY